MKATTNISEKPYMDREKNNILGKKILYFATLVRIRVFQVGFGYQMKCSALSTAQGVPDPSSDVRDPRAAPARDIFHVCDNIRQVASDDQGVPDQATKDVRDPIEATRSIPARVSFVSSSRLNSFGAQGVPDPSSDVRDPRAAPARDIFHVRDNIRQVASDDQGVPDQATKDVCDPIEATRSIPARVSFVSSSRLNSFGGPFQQSSKVKR
ncbi:hypothetical protein F2Q68_00035291 [Brassica cretica]|uniref:Uncharacterized protein n=1 Tax=Brassica cretica TaxID=69181 RepID=A0A8S9H919_BRACR|nr:hypothetical protein F2Q68_00035291 [Brassica cretica]